MIAPEFLAMLVCPQSRQPLRVATAAELAAVQQAIAAGRARNRAGQPVAEAIDGGLVVADGSALYPVRQGIPILLSGEAIPLQGAMPS
jgi:uncharacterized protein YbaR (Trm112 family)